MYHVDTNKIRNAHDICSSSQSRVPFNMVSSITLDQFKGDGSQHLKTWWNKFQQLIDLYDIPQEKLTKIATFLFSDYGEVWYATLSPEITNDLSKFKTAFFEGFTEDDHILYLSILQTAQSPNESVRDYLSRLFHTATNKDISDQVLLALRINELRPEIKAIVMNKELRNIEKFRHNATLAEKTVSSIVKCIIRCRRFWHYTKIQRNVYISV